MTIRRAIDSDLPAIVNGMWAIYSKSGWAAIRHPDYSLTPNDLWSYIVTMYASPFSVIFVSDLQNSITAFCGGVLDRTQLPPFVPMVYEWGWWQDGKHPRESARCFQAVERWGKSKGAVISGYCLGKAGGTATTAYENRVFRLITHKGV